MNSEKTIFVYDSFTSNRPVLLGYLYHQCKNGKNVFSFEYNEDWLKSDGHYLQLDPELSNYSGRQYCSKDGIFGLFSDASPDRWGRMLINKKEKIEAKKENRKPRKLTDYDYLLGVSDKVRMGGLRFKLDDSSNFLSDDIDLSVPPIANLRKLENASINIENNEDAFNEKWLNQLLEPGSSLGGARPKATVVDTKDQLWIAKFPSKNDDTDVGAWEKVASDLARLCGLDVPESKIEKFSDIGSTFIVKRFDRKGNMRVHFASAMTLLSKTDGASFEDGSSYLDILSFIRSNGSDPNKDTLELFKRIAFYMAISNTDDHLRNHAFIYTKTGWKLSPVFDVNPVPYGEELTLNINEYDNNISKETLVDSSYYYNLKKDEALKIVDNILLTVKDNYEFIAKKYNISRADIEYMRPAFSLCCK